MVISFAKYFFVGYLTHYRGGVASQEIYIVRCVTIPLYNRFRSNTPGSRTLVYCRIEENHLRILAGTFWIKFDRPKTGDETCRNLTQTSYSNCVQMKFENPTLGRVPLYLIVFLKHEQNTPPFVPRPSVLRSHTVRTKNISNSKRVMQWEWAATDMGFY